MHYFVYKLIPKQMLGKRPHHSLYLAATQSYDHANTRIDVFYAMINGRKVSINDMHKVDTLVRSLKKSHRMLQHHTASAAETSTRKKVGEIDYRYILKCEKDVGFWLSNAVALQEKLRRQMDAEQWFHKQEQEKMKEETWQTRQAADQRPSHSSSGVSARRSTRQTSRQPCDQGSLPIPVRTSSQNSNMTYLSAKPLPPLRKSMSLSALPTQGKKQAPPSHKDVQALFRARDSEITSIIESYRRTKYHYDADDFTPLPSQSATWT